MQEKQAPTCLEQMIHGASVRAQDCGSPRGRVRHSAHQASESDQATVRLQLSVTYRIGWSCSKDESFDVLLPYTLLKCSCCSFRWQPFVLVLWYWAVRGDWLASWSMGDANIS